jgi:hypothetical protein
MKITIQTSKKSVSIINDKVEAVEHEGKRTTYYTVSGTMYIAEGIEEKQQISGNELMVYAESYSIRRP